MGNSSPGRLLASAEKGDAESVRKLIAKKVNVNGQTRGGWTALMKAYTEIVQLLIGAKADVNATNSVGRTALMFAAEKGRTKIVQLLIIATADVNAKDNNFGQTTLMRAASYGHTEIVQLLIDAKVDVSLADNRGKTALVYAEKHIGAHALLQAAAVGYTLRCKECGTMNVPSNNCCASCSTQF